MKPLIDTVIALRAAIAKTAGNFLLSTPMRIYVSFFRGTPMLAQLFQVYYGAGQFRVELMNANLWWFFIEPINCAIPTFALNTGAYQTGGLHPGLRLFVFLLAGMAYLVMTMAFVNLWSWLERKLNPQWTALAIPGK